MSRSPALLAVRPTASRGADARASGPGMTTTSTTAITTITTLMAGTG